MAGMADGSIMAQMTLQGVFVLRIFSAGLLGAVIGIERKNRNKLAGVRTHAIVALGAALMMVVSKYGFYDIVEYDASRVAAQIVSGVGFLGAGIIFVRNSNSVSGLTTAAGIWATAGVGMSMGSGLYVIGVCSAALIIGMQVLLHRISFLANEAYPDNVKVVINNAENSVQEIEAFIAQEKIAMRTIKINKSDKNNIKIDLELVFPPGYNKTKFINGLADKKNVISVRG